MLYTLNICNFKKLKQKLRKQEPNKNIIEWGEGAHKAGC